MSTFEYKGFDSSGRARKGLTEAPDLKSAREKLAREGVLPEKVVPAGSRGSQFSGRSNLFSMERRIFFFRETAALLRAGMPLTGTLDSLVSSPDTGSVRTLIAGIRDRIKEGASFAAAAGHFIPGMTDYEKSVLESGEKTGSLAAVLENLAAYLEEKQNLHDSIRSAMLYPAVVLILAVLLAVGLLGFAVPRIIAMLREQGNIDLPPITRVMMVVGQVMAVAAPVLAAIAIPGILLVRKRIRSDKTAAVAFGKRLFSIPFFGRALALLSSMRFARTLSMLLRGGVDIIEAMAMAGSSTGNAWVASLVSREIESVRHGASLADAIRRIPPLAEYLPRWVHIGETAGTLDSTIEQAATHLQKKWDRAVSRGLSMLEPAIILFVGGLVFLIVLSIVLPLTAINSISL